MATAEGGAVEVVKVLHLLLFHRCQCEPEIATFAAEVAAETVHFDQNEQNSMALLSGLIVR